MSETLADTYYRPVEMIENSPLQEGEIGYNEFIRCLRWDYWC